MYLSRPLQQRLLSRSNRLVYSEACRRPFYTSLPMLTNLPPLYRILFLDKSSSVWIYFCYLSCFKSIFKQIYRHRQKTTNIQVIWQKSNIKSSNKTYPTSAKYPIPMVKEKKMVLNYWLHKHHTLSQINLSPVKIQLN